MALLIHLQAPQRRDFFSPAAFTAVLKSTLVVSSSEFLPEISRISLGALKLSHLELSVLERTLIAAVMDTTVGDLRLEISKRFSTYNYLFLVKYSKWAKGQVVFCFSFFPETVGNSPLYNYLVPQILQRIMGLLRKRNNSSYISHTYSVCLHCTFALLHINIALSMLILKRHAGK